MTSSVLKGLKSLHSRNPYVAFDQDGPVSPFPLSRSNSKSGSFFSSPLGLRRKTAAVKQPEKTFVFFLSLPYELQCEVMKFIGFRDMCNLQRASKLLNAIASENLIWKNLFQQHWSVPLEILDTYGSFITDWQAHFKQQLFLHKRPFLKSEKVKDCLGKPAPRFAHTGSTYNGHVYYIGGQVAEARSNEIWDYNVKANKFSLTEISNHDSTLGITQKDIKEDCSNFEGVDGLVPKFARHQSVIVGHKIYSFGGYDYSYFYNLSVFNIKKGTWTYPKVKGDIPIPRSNHSAAAIGHHIYIFGGSIGDKPDKYTVTKDFYCLNTKTMTWRKIQMGNSVNEPSERVGHVMAGIGHHLYLFGGGIWGKEEGWTAQSNDLYVYDTKEHIWSLVPVPKETKPPVCTYPFVFTLKNNFCIFGGASMEGSTVKNQMYMWDVLLRKWIELQITGEIISPRSIGTANVVGNELVLWGGYCGGVVRENDLYKLRFALPARLTCLGSP